MNTLFLKFSKTDAALPVQLIRMRPSTREGLAIPNLARTFAPAPSPSPITYFTCRKSSTVTRSSPSVCSVGNWKLITSKVKYFQILIHFQLSSTYFGIQTQLGSSRGYPFYSANLSSICIHTTWNTVMSYMLPKSSLYVKYSVIWTAYT